MRVVANNPELNGQNAHQAEIDPATWRNVRLRMEKPDGGELLVTLLRSAEWRETHNAEPGNTIRLTFVELGIDGPADVLAVEACPTIKSGDGRVVTGTFRHSAANVIDLYVTSDDQPIGTTANHPFWSETRQDFVQAGNLQPGEELRTATGASAHVRQLTPRSRSAEVFNLEVDAEHCYAVGRNGLVVHNSNSYNNGLPNGVPSARLVHDKYVQQVRPGAGERVFDTPWSKNKGLGSRKFDDFDDMTGTGFEGNTTPWSQMTQEQLSRKLDQVGSDFALLKTDPQVRRIIWFGTEELPTTGLGGKLRLALKDAGIPYWVVTP